MKIFGLLVIVLMMLSCKSDESNEVALFNEVTFKMNEGEAAGVVNARIQKKYSEYFNNGKIQVPLFKYISHKNYDIFIGIPYDSPIEVMVQNQLELQDSTVTDFSSDSLFYYKKYKKNEFYITEYAAKIETNSLIYISTMAISEELTDSLFNRLDLSNRINSNNK